MFAISGFQQGEDRYQERSDKRSETSSSQTTERIFLLRMNPMGPGYSRKVSSMRSRQALGVGRQNGGNIFSTVKRRRRRPSKVQKGGRIFQESPFVPAFEPENVKW